MSFGKQCYAVAGGFTCIKVLGKITWSCIFITQFCMDSVYISESSQTEFRVYAASVSMGPSSFSMAAVPGYSAVILLGMA